MVAHKSRDTRKVTWVTQILAWDAFKPSQLISIRGWARSMSKLATLKESLYAFFSQCT